MDVTFFEFVALFVAFVGLAGPALGLLGLMRRQRQGLAWHFTAFAFVAVLIAGATWTAAARWPVAVWGPVFAFAAFLLAVQAGQCSPGRRLAAAALAVVQGPRFHWGVLIIACPLLTLWLGWRVELLVDSASPDFDTDVHPELVLSEKEPVTFVTDVGKAVTVHRVLDVTQADVGPQPDRDLMAKWVGKVIQTAPADPVSNCHGWVYAGGLYWVNEIAVEAILTDNGYRAVTDPQVGDVITYRNEKGLAAHSGVVRVVEPSMTLIESKWGAQGRYLHRPREQPYGQQFTYYRSPRQGHVISGLTAPKQAGGVTSFAASRSQGH